MFLVLVRKKWKISKLLGSNKSKNGSIKNKKGRESLLGTKK